MFVLDIDLGFTIESGLQQGIIWGILVIGVYISFRILDFADLSIEGTFPLGACISALLIFKGWNPFLAIFISLLVGLLAGLLTGILHTKLKIPAILSGIITMTALSSLDLVILGLSLADRSNGSNALASLPIDNDIFTVVFKQTSGLFEKMGIAQKDAITIVTIGVSAIFLALVAFGVYWLFGTEIGMNLRATGNNPKMARAQGINTDVMIILGLMLSNGLIALSGALFAQSYGTAQTESGRGAIVIGLAAIILGEIIFGRKRSFKVSLISIIVGSIIFFFIKALAIELKVEHYLNLIIAIMIAFILALPLLKGKIKFKRKTKEGTSNARD